MKTTKPATHNATDYARIALCVPTLRVGDIAYNRQQITTLAHQATAQSAEVIVFPELSMSGYTLGDLFENTHLLNQVENELLLLAEKLADIPSIVIIGAPLRWRDKLYNCAVALHGGQLVGVVPKTFLPNYREFYEKRWFTSGKNIVDEYITIGSQQVPFGTDVLFEIEQATIGVEICEDLWAPEPPSTTLARAGAQIIINPSASNELVGKAEYRRSLVQSQSARIIAAYAYVGCGVHESTADVVYGGHAILAANGSILGENNRFATDSHMIVHDVDVAHIRHDRQANTSFEAETDIQFRRIKTRQSATAKETLLASIPAHPFVPANPLTLSERAEEILTIQAHGLATNLRNADIQKVILGLSGGLDSTLALLVAIRAMDILKLSPKNIHAITMPGFASSTRTQSNARKLATALGTKFTETPINDATNQMLSAIGHNGMTQDVTYENAQARTRTEILMNTANQEHGLVLGTGDLSEIALGWATFNGDHMSMYNVNASIPKTLVRHLVRWVSSQPDFKKAKSILEDILDTPVSPELKDGNIDGIGQKTEDIIGPYELHDFFLYHLVRYGDGFDKIYALGCEAFADTYTEAEIERWLKEFAQRFTRNQFKRESAPNGPKVGTVSLSQRGDWRMPPGASEAWIL